MIEMNIQREQQERISKQAVSLDLEAGTETGLTVTCAICEATYAPASFQVPFLQNTRGALEAAFLSMCHFCFRCRRAACPQCWDDVNGVCGACVQDAGLPFRSEVAPLAGLAYPPRREEPLIPLQQQHMHSLFVPVHNGRFATEGPVGATQVETDISTDPTPIIQFTREQTLAPDPLAAEEEQDNGAMTSVMLASIKTPRLDTLQDTRAKKKTSRVPKKARKASRLEAMLTWTLLVIVLALVIVIALAEYSPAVNSLIARVTHIDIHAEIAYLVRIVQQLFKK